MAMKKKLRLIVLFCAMLCLGLEQAYTEEPVKKEQTAPAMETTPPAPSSTPSQPQQPPLEFSPPAPPPVTPSYENAIIKMVVTIIGLIFFVFLTIWVMRRLGHGRFPGFGSNRSIQVIERKPLSPKSMLYLVQVGHKKFLIAETQLEVRQLGCIEELSESESDETS